MRILITEEEIEKRISEIANIINRDYENKELTVVVLLKGAFQTASTLMKRLNGDIKIEFIKVSSYDGYESSGKLKQTLDLSEDLTGKNLLLVDDIIDTGNTLYNLKKEYFRRNAADIKIFTLLDKKAKRKHEIEADYVGFEIENKFVIGYGLDDNESYRELPYIGVLNEDI